MRTKIDLIKQDLLQHGFTHLKIEMEGSTGRRYDSDGAIAVFDAALPQDLHVAYRRIFSDGGDTEITITFSTEQLEHAPSILRAFNAVARHYRQRQVFVRSAGMHLSLLTGPSYPTNDSIFTPEQLDNFKAQVTKLLPSLLVYAAHSNWTRHLGPRGLQVSHTIKYSAIYTHGGTCFEFRIFDTCYHEPKRVIDNFAVMANCIQYLNVNKTCKAEAIPIQSSSNISGKWHPVNAHFLKNQHKALIEQMQTIKPRWTNPDHLVALKLKTKTEQPYATRFRDRSEIASGLYF